jgi:DNA-binding MarR family transcriptional regulator
MAGVLARMEETGLIARERMAQDQRRVMVELSPQGRALLTQIGPLIDQQYRYIEQAYGKQVIAGLFLAMENFTALEQTEVGTVTLP